MYMYMYSVHVHLYMFNHGLLVSTVEAFLNTQGLASGKGPWSPDKDHDHVVCTYHHTEPWGVYISHIPLC